MAEALGKSRSHIANLLRLLNLPDAVLEMVRGGDLSAGIARALVSAEDPLKLAKEIVAKGLSVRATEALVKKMSAPAPEKNRTCRTRLSWRRKGCRHEGTGRDLSASLGMKVRLDHKPGQESGQLVVSYQTLDELDELCRILSQG